MLKGSVVANFSLHGCKTVNLTYLKKNPAFVRCPVSGVTCVVTKNRS